MADDAPAGGMSDDPARGSTYPPEVVAARDRLFDDADMHGPRWPVLSMRALPAITALAVTQLLSSTELWRRIVIERTSDAISDFVLVAPVMAAAVGLALALAPTARTRVEPLVAGALVLMAVGTWLVAQGWLAAATIPSTLAAAFAGIAAARAVRRAVWTLPLLIAAGASDARSVSGGVTRQLLDGTGVSESAATVTPELTIPPELVANIDYFVLHVPAATGTWLLGLVDVVAVGLLLGLAHLLWLPLGRTAVALAAALALTVGAGVPVPVLPMLGIAWVAVHAKLVWRATRFSLRRLTYLGG